MLSADGDTFDPLDEELWTTASGFSHLTRSSAARVESRPDECQSSAGSGRRCKRFGSAPGRRAHLDVAYESELVDIELDGSRYHFGFERRERDMRRDAALAALGWLVLRFSHRRLHEEPDAVRREILATLEVRRRQLGSR